MGYDVAGLNDYIVDLKVKNSEVGKRKLFEEHLRRSFPLGVPSPCHMNLFLKVRIRILPHFLCSFRTHSACSERCSKDIKRESFTNFPRHITSKLERVQ